ncbi:MAG: dTDP-4-dehydrorhamnose reductase [Candidatus Kerfeldbacteria bacterium]|nr:dTDP-4-dehydrorhamnose reductase [Candidatus Kerfeldbacteria bacterium]
MKVLIIGADGTLGTALRRVLVSESVIAWTSADLDLSDLNSIAPKINSIRPEIVINAAAFTDVDQAEQDERRATIINGLAVGELAAACASFGSRFVQFSTDYVFDGRRSSGYDEQATPTPISAYGRSKYRGEQLLQQRGRDWLLIRTSRLFGQANGSSSKLDFVRRMLELAKTKPVVSVVNDETASPTYANDLAQATVALIQSGATGVFHRTNDGSCTWFGLAKEIFALVNVSVRLNPVSGSAFPRPAARPRYSVLRSTKLPPLRPWPAALHDYLLTFGERQI